MKKPEIIKIKLPISEKYFKTATKAYFRSLRGKTVDIRFSDQRERKVFKYEIVGSSSTEEIFLTEKRKQCEFDLQFQKEE